MPFASTRATRAGVGTVGGAKAMAPAVCSVVEGIERAESVVSELKLVGLPSSEISILMPDTRAPLGASAETDRRSMGGALGWLTEVGATQVDGLGPLIGAGPLRRMLGPSSDLTGLAGALHAAGVPDTARCLAALRDGATLVAVHAETAAERRAVQGVFVRAGAAPA